MALLASLMLVLAACGPDRESSEGQEEGQSEETGSETNEEASEGEGEADKPEQLKVWADEKKSVGIEDAVAAFEEEHGIEVVVEELEMATKQKNSYA